MRREKVAAREVAELDGGGGGGVEPGSDGGGAPPLEGGLGVVPDAGGGEPCAGDGAVLGEGEEEPVTLTLSFWPLLQWPGIEHAK